MKQLWNKQKENRKQVKLPGCPNTLVCLWSKSLLFVGWAMLISRFSCLLFSIHFTCTIIDYHINFEVLLCVCKEGFSEPGCLDLQKFSSPSIWSKYFSWPGHFFPRPGHPHKKVVNRPLKTDCLIMGHDSFVLYVM